MCGYVSSPNFKIEDEEELTRKGCIFGIRVVNRLNNDEPGEGFLIGKFSLSDIVILDMGDGRKWFEKYARFHSCLYEQIVSSSSRFLLANIIPLFSFFDLHSPDSQDPIFSGSALGLHHPFLLKNLTKLLELVRFLSLSHIFFFLSQFMLFLHSIHPSFLFRNCLFFYSQTALLFCIRFCPFYSPFLCESSL